jgi:deoxyribonuclease-4
MESLIKNRLGVHIRMNASLYDVIARADSLELPFFQCFFVSQESSRLIQPTSDEVRAFLKERRSRYDDLFCHASYWVNLASLGNNGYPQLRREIVLAKRLEFTHIVLHAGTAKGAVDKSEGIDALAIALNNLFKRERDITILLENTCHANLAIGSDILDFKQLLEKLDKPERIGFCIDTAHAHSFGYNIADSSGHDAFIDFLDATIGIDRIKLIHLNDTVELLGSRIDRHGIVGQGRIGTDALKAFVLHQKLQNIPLLMELPDLPVGQERVILDRVRGW